ncbi:MAG: hypothetical protein F6K42_20640 [Leptolyngbya sp. SIO1D8]|nr:hypothetical protein [Leptolyngbya sp. SIO1D8]
MREKKLEHLVYQLKQLKEHNLPKPIVLLGAGCSVSAGIPVASKIVQEICEKHDNHPDIKNIHKEKISYAELMECLGPTQRKKIFGDYVQQANINVTHIYLAHLLQHGYIDYILTVNFDNLAQRALSLYNIFPPTYDLSNLRDLTTTSIEPRSITYLHGKYDGLWQLNTKEEMKRVIENNVAKDVFTKITNKRMWIVIGYSGEDFIFDQLVKLGRFDDGLYWVGYEENPPVKRVQEKLLNLANSECFWVKGYDADRFFLKLNAELGNPEPQIFNKPISFLAELQNNIVDIDDTQEYKEVNKRFTESKKLVKDAIERYEKGVSGTNKLSDKDIIESKLQKDLVNCLINEDYNKLDSLEALVLEHKFKHLHPTLANIYSNFGLDLAENAVEKPTDEAKKLFHQAFEKFELAIHFDPEDAVLYSNWGT